MTRRTSIRRVRSMLWRTVHSQVGQTIRRNYPPLYDIVQLENRLFLSFAPAMAGPPTVSEGSAYTYTFLNTGTTAAQSYSLTAGDGSSPGNVTATGAVTTLQHTYSIGTYAPSAVPKDSGGLTYFAMPLTLDSTFGPNATGEVTTHGTTGSDSAYAMAVQSDGKIVLAGYSTNNNSDIELARYNSDGSIDTTFGTNGIVTTNLGTLSNGTTLSTDRAYAVAIDYAGDIIVGGYSNLGEVSSGNYDFMVARYTSAGALDTSFNTTGFVTTDFGGGAADVVNAMAIDANGCIVVAGQSNGSFAAARYNPDGSLDTTFHTTGKLTVSVPGYSNASVQGLAVQSDGKLVLGGFAYSTTYGNDFGLARLSSDGTLDTAFGSNGFVTTDYCVTSCCGPNGDDNDYSLVLQPDGKIIAAGSMYNSLNNDFAVVRYNTNGSLDTTFGGGTGKVHTDFSSGYDYGYAAALQPDGKIVVAGTAHSSSPYNVGDNFGLIRYNADGTLDSTFGSSGLISTDFGGSNDSARAVTVLPSGSIIAAGFATMSGTSNFALAQYNPTNTLTVIPAVDQLTVSAVSTSEIDLNWNNNNTATSATIEVDRSTDGTNFTALTTTLPSYAVSYQDTTGLSENTHYWYRVRAILRSGQTAFTSADTYTLPNAPTGLTATANGTSEIDLAWTNGSSSTPSFFIERSDDNGNTFSTIDQTAAGATTYADLNVSPGTTYYYRVDAASGAGAASAPSGTAQATTTLIAPSNVAATGVSSSEIDLSWTNNISDGLSIEVDRSSDGVNYTVLTSTLSGTATSYQDTGLTENTTYWYEVRAQRPSGPTNFSDPAVGSSLPAESGVTATGSSPTTMDLSWTYNSTCSACQEIDRSTDGTTYSELQLLPFGTTTYTDSTVQEGTQYWYEVRATANGVNSAFSTPATAWTPPIAPSGLSVTSTVNNQVQLSWTNNSLHAASFNINRSSDGGITYSPVGTTDGTTTTFTDASAAAGTAYSYQVTAAAGDGTASTAPAAAPVTTPIAGVASPAASAASDTEVDLSWTLNSGNLTGINVYSSTDGQTYSLLTPTPLPGNSTSYANTGLTQNTQYYYQVQGVQSSGNTWYATAATPTAPSAPTNLTGTAPSGYEVDLNWISHSGWGPTFDVERSTDGVHFTSIDNGNGTGANSEQDVGVVPSTTYYYRVRAVAQNGAPPSSYSPVFSIMTPAAPPLAQSALIQVQNPIPPNHPAGQIWYTTISAAAAHAVAGTTVLIHGGVYHETVTPPVDGSATAPIVFRAAGDGPVVVSGADALTGFHADGTSIWTAPISISSQGVWNGQKIIGPTATTATNQVFMLGQGFTPSAGLTGGEMVPEARYPYITFAGQNPTATQLETVRGLGGSRGPTVYSFTDTTIDLPQPTGFWQNALIHIVPGNSATDWHNSQWVGETALVTNDVTNGTTRTITYKLNSNTSLTGTTLAVGDHYYLFNPQKNASTALANVDSGNQPEYVIDTLSSASSTWVPPSSNASLYIHYKGPRIPTNVYIKTRDAAFDLRWRKYIVIHGINLFAATIYTNGSSNHDTFEHLTATYLSSFDRTGGTDHTGLHPINGWVGEVDSGIELLGNYDQLLNSEIAYCAGNGVMVNGANNTVSGCNIHDVDTIGNDCAAVFAYGNTQSIDHNTAYNSGRSLIVHRSIYASKIMSNQLYNPGLQTTDCGATYTDGNIKTGAFNDGGNTEIAYNLVHDIPGSVTSAGGIYLDNNTKNYLIDHNVVYNTPTAAVKMNRDSQNNQVYNNTLDPGGSTAIVTDSNHNTGTPFSGTVIQNNNILTGTSHAWPSIWSSPGFTPSTQWINNPAVPVQSATGSSRNYAPKNPTAVGALLYGAAYLTPGANLRATANWAGNGTLSWSAAVNQSSTKYYVERRSANGPWNTRWKTLNAPATSLTVTYPASNAPIYYYRVVAVNGNGLTSAISNQVAFYGDPRQ